MRSFLTYFLALLLPVAARTQDPAVPVSMTRFDQTTMRYLICQAEGWRFRPGNDTAWSKKELDTSGWTPLKPADLTAAYADKNGKVEGWFRIKIKLDSALKDSSLWLKSGGWAAIDLYINGRLAYSFGNTGINGKPFQEYSPYGNPSVDVNLKKGNEYTLAMHLVDRLSPLPPYNIRSEYAGLFQLISLTAPQYNASVLVKDIQQLTIYYTTWVAVCAVLSLLFWLLYLQVPLEKNLRLIALCPTFLMLYLFFNSLFVCEIGVPFTRFLLYRHTSELFFGLGLGTIPLVIIHIFKRRVTTRIKVFLGIFLAYAIFSGFLPDFINNPAVSGAFLLALYAICGYYIVSSWTTLKGAQWAIVTGVLLSLTFGLLFILASIWNSGPGYTRLFLCITGYALSLPLSLLVYVAMRFKEIIKEVQLNADRIVQLSDEKKQEALNRQKVLEQEVQRQTAEIRSAFDDLKSTQDQLIQSEKMASLGELTAGIAHEIQNPLNFVNNFSEVSVELLEELKEEAGAGNKEEVIAIAGDLVQNLEKIIHHGRRADNIVKGMLQHSRAGSGQKEPTDLNTLADEYLRLSYHGLRAKDKSFNADLITHFDTSLPKIKVVRQDIGRVLLNLFNNAFYAVRQKQQSEGADYKPTVEVSTSLSEGMIRILVKDNGTGIPEAIKEKIMQPFFTTKPTGEGTGLGLSLSYDIIVKAHGGKISINSTEGNGAGFLITLPTGLSREEQQNILAINQV